MDRRSFIGGAAAFYGALLGDAKAAGTSRAPKLRIREVRAIRLKNGFNPRFVRVYQLESWACNGGASSCPDNSAATGLHYVERYRRTTVADVVP